ncbi:MAG: right-handed parallel beta-helix repeat-containing protein [Opitutales bacterium]
MFHRRLLLLLFPCVLVLVLPSLHARDWVVNPAHAEADDAGMGTAEAPLETISEAAERARPGDVVRVHPGVYREFVRPPRGGEPGQPIRYESVERHGAVIRASEPAGHLDWQRVEVSGKTAYRVEIPEAWVRGYNPFAIRAARMNGYYTLGQVFYDGKPLAQADHDNNLTLVAGSWLADRDGSAVTVYPDPADGAWDPERVDLAVRKQCFAPVQRGTSRIAVVGFVMEHAANQFANGFWAPYGNPQAGALSTRSGTHWTIAHNRILWANSVGMDVGAEGDADGELWQAYSEQDRHHRIAFNEILDSGAAGIMGAGARYIEVIGNVVLRSNRHGWAAPETGGMKFHYVEHSRIEGNLVNDNDSYGIWLDNRYKHTVVRRNVVMGNTAHGIFFEMGRGPALADHNVVAYNGRSGIYAHDAEGVRLVHNLIGYNQQWGVLYQTVSERGDPPFKASGARVFNNIFIRNHRGHLALPADGPRSEDNAADWNLYINDRKWPTDGMGRNQFSLHFNQGRTPLDEVWAIIAAGAYPDASEDALAVHRQHWEAQQVLGADAWQAASGWDANSVFASLREGAIVNGAVSRWPFSFNRHARNLVLRDLDLFTQMTCPPQPELAVDFYGNPYPENPDTRVYPGPFQQMPFRDYPENKDKAEAYIFPLWRPEMTHSPAAQVAP